MRERGEEKSSVSAPPVHGTSVLGVLEAWEILSSEGFKMS